MKQFPRSVWLFALAIALATTLPYIIGWLQTPAGWRYTGALPIPFGAQVDYFSHMAKMWQGSRGQWDYHLLFTHEEHPGITLLQVFYVALGALTQIIPISLPLMYQVARFGLTVGTVLAVWAFACRFFEKRSERWLVTLFGTIVSGWSWLLLFIDPASVANVSPIEFWLTDAFNVLGALYMPHFTAAVIFQIVILLSFDNWVREQTNRVAQAGVRHALSRPMIILTFALAAEALIQPYIALLLAPLLVTLAAYHIFSAKRLRIQQALWLLIPLGVHAVLVVYQYVTVNADPVWAAFSAQNQTLSPPVIYYVLGYLTFIIPIVLGARLFMVDQPDDHWWMPILWVAYVAMLLYAPFPTQRRYLIGVQTPLAVVAAYGWSRAVLPTFRPTLRRLVSVAYFLLASIGLLSMVLINMVAMTKPAAHTDVYNQPDELAGYTWLAREADPNDLVLTVFDGEKLNSGGRLVAAVGQRVFLGHWIETIQFQEKLAEVQRFYNSVTDDAWRREFLKRTGVMYIWYDEDARAMGDWNPAGADYLESVFESETLTIWKVKN